MEANQSYREVLRDRHVAGLLIGDLLSNVGTGMLIVAMPVQTLSIHGDVPKAIAIGLVEAAPFVLSTVLALFIGLGRVRIPPRTLLIADCVLRSLTLVALGVLAVTDHLTLNVLILGLLFGSTFLLAGQSSRRVLATSMAGDQGRFAVNGLLGLNLTFALLVVGPVLGGVIVATTSPGVALFFDAGGALLLLAAVFVSVPRAVKDRDALRQPAAHESGWRILRRRPVAARLLVVEFFFNFLYMPIEVALPLFVHGTLGGDASALGLMWGALGAGAFIGALLVNQLRNLPQRQLLIAIIGLWAICPIALAPRRRSGGRDDHLRAGRPGVGAVHAGGLQLHSVGSGVQRAAAGRHAVDHHLNGVRTARPRDRRAADRAHRGDRRPRGVRRAHHAAAADRGTRGSQAHKEPRYAGRGRRGRSIRNREASLVEPELA